MRDARGTEARCFAVADPADGKAAVSLARRIAAQIASDGACALLIDSAGSSVGQGVRRLSEAISHLDHLKGDALQGYLSAPAPDGRAAANAGAVGEVVCDAPLDGDALGMLAAQYDLVIFAFGPASFGIAGGAATSIPAAILARASEDGGLAAAGRLIDRMLEEKGLPRPVAFVLEGSDRSTAARLANRWRLPFWGSADDAAHIVERILARAVPIPKPDLPIIGEAEASAHSAAINRLSNRGRDAIARDILAALRAEQEFKGIRVPAGKGEAGARLKLRVAAAARRLIGEIDPQRLVDVDIESLIAKIVDDAAGFGPIEALLADPYVTEIMVNGVDNIYVERGGIIEPAPLSFVDVDHLKAVVERMVSETGRRIDESSPMVDARLPDGSRLNVIIPPLAVDGPAITIRRFVGRMRSMADATSSGMITPQAAGFLAACVGARISIVVSGGTGAGKTTLLNVFASAIEPGERVVTIEDAAELSLSAQHVVRLESRPPSIEGKGRISIRDLVRNALRMRPDRIIVGECRGPEALDMLQAMNTGHEGSLTTVHANSPRDALARIETMVMMADIDLPLAAVREQIARAIDLIVQVARVRGGARRVTEISEVTGMEGPTICMQTLAHLSGDDGKFESTGLAPRFAERLRERGMELPSL